LPGIKGSRFVLTVIISERIALWYSRQPTCLRSLFHSWRQSGLYEGHFCKFSGCRWSLPWLSLAPQHFMRFNNITDFNVGSSSR